MGVNVVNSKVFLVGGQVSIADPRCCCDACETKPAILERQTAAGVDTSNYIDTSATYALWELCDEANKFAAGLTDGVWLSDTDLAWAGGATGPTTKGNANYFDTSGSPVVTITSDTQLCAEVQKFQGSIADTPINYLTRQVYDGSASGTTLDSAKTGAIADWAINVGATVNARARAGLIRTDSDDWTASLAMSRHKIDTDMPVDERLARGMKMYINTWINPGNYDSYDTQGWSVVEDEWALYLDTTKGAGVSNSSEFAGTTDYPPNWPDDPDTANTNLAIGWTINSSAYPDSSFILVTDWDFAF